MEKLTTILLTVSVMTTGSFLDLVDLAGTPALLDGGGSAGTAGTFAATGFGGRMDRSV